MAEPRRNLCAECSHYDIRTKDHNDFMVEGRDNYMKWACRRYPEVIFKQAGEWCGEWTKR